MTTVPPPLLSSLVDEAAMNTKIFLESVLGSNGYYCVFGSRLSDDKKVQKFYDSIDAVIDATTNLDQEGYDAYFALGTFEEAGTRKAFNVLQLKSFFLDLDCGEGKDYAEQSEALDSLRSFCETAKLPRPTIINSGRGIHAYWPLTEAISRDEWTPVAEHLKQLCAEYGFVADPAVTADSARVLRVPNTHNHKDEPPKIVSIVGELADPISLEDFKALLGENAFTPVAHKSFIPSDMNAVMQALSGSYVSKFRTIMIKSAEGKGCAQLAQAYMDQENISEPQWRAALSIAAFCEDRGTAIHKLSNKYSGYSFDATEDKVSRIKGPYLCERFNEYRPGVCTGCQHWGKIKSPISLGREVEEATEEDNVVLQKPADIPVEKPQEYVIPKFPAPYFRGKGGGIFKRMRDEDGDNVEVPVYHNDLYMTSVIEDPDAGTSVVLRLHLPHDGVKEFTVPLSAMTSKEELRKYMAFNGVAIIKVDEIMAYLTQWFNELQQKSAANDARRQFGWTDKTMQSFVIGNMEIHADRVDVNPPSAATAGLMPMFKPSGTFEEWKETLNFYNRPGFEVHQFVVGIGFGSVLMEMFPINGAIFHVFSKDSGLGKTTAMYAGASIWGNPDMLVLQERDTYNSKMNRAEIYKNLPFFSDEMTNTIPKDLSDFAYQMPSGQQRNRMGAKGNVERTRGEPWKLIAATTGNTSMLERISLYKSLPKAEAQRILEYRAKRMHFSSKEETDIFSEKLKTHFGHGAVPYIQYIIRNLEGIRTLAKSVQVRVDNAAGLSQENRFWSIIATIGLLGIMTAKKAGLVGYDVAPVSNWIVDLMKHNKDNVTEMGGDVESILTDYLAENYNNVLRIKSTDDARKGATGLDHLITPDALPRSNLVARYEYDIKRLYLLPKPLKEWCGKQQINYSGFVDGLKTGRTKAENGRQRLGKGTNMNLPAVPVIVVDCSEFMNEETEQTIAAGAAILEKQAEA